MPEPAPKEQTPYVRESAAVYGASVGLRGTNRKTVIKRLREGLPFSSFEKLRSAIDMSASELARVVSIAPRTLARRKETGRLQSDESERVLRIGHLLDLAQDVLGDAKKAQTWLKSPNRALGGSSPLGYADTEPGAREVEELLGRIDHGNEWVSTNGLQNPHRPFSRNEVYLHQCGDFVDVFDHGRFPPGT